jgi:hypothetical protein
MVQISALNNRILWEGYLILTLENITSGGVYFKERWIFLKILSLSVFRASLLKKVVLLQFQDDVEWQTLFDSEGDPQLSLWYLAPSYW